LLETAAHEQLQNFVADLNLLYQREPALHQVDASWEGFQWIDFADAEQSIISFVRRSAQADEQIIIVCNFTPVPRPGYRVGLPINVRYQEILNSDRPEYGGSGIGNPTTITAEAIPWQSCQYSAALNLPPLGVIMLKPE